MVKIFMKGYPSPSKGDYNPRQLPNIHLLNSFLNEKQ